MKAPVAVVGPGPAQAIPPPPNATAPAGGRANVAFGLAANLLLRVAAAAAGVALTLRLTGMPEMVGPAAIGLLGGLDSAVELLVAVPAGRLSDRWGRRPLLLGGAVAAAVGLLIAGLGNTLALLTLGRAVQGLGTGLTVPPLLGWFSDEAAARPGGRRGRVMAGVEAGTAAGLLIGTVVGRVIWSAARASGFPLLAALFVGAAALFTRAPGLALPTSHGAPPLGHPQPAGGLPVPAGGWLGDVRAVLRTPGLSRLLVAWVLLNGVVGLWLTHAVYQMNAGARDAQQFLVGIGREDLRLGPVQTEALPVILALWMLLFIAGSLAWGPLLARIEAWLAMRVALVGMLLVCLALAFINAADVAPAARWVAVAVFCAGVVLEAGFAPAALTRLATDAAAARRGMTMGLYSVAFGLGSVGGSWLGGPFSALGGMNGIIVATAILAASALATLTIGHRPAPGHLQIASVSLEP